MSSSCVVTLVASISNNQTVMGFIFSIPLSFDLSTAIANRLLFIIVTRAARKYYASAPFMIQLVFVCAEAYQFTISMSGKMSLIEGTNGR